MTDLHELWEQLRHLPPGPLPQADGDGINERLIMWTPPGASMPRIELPEGTPMILFGFNCAGEIR